ncbi:AAA family ATPase [Lachnospira multipara]|uniref:AAA family ATPase n=1 Tax=Lachnospira multipara TaxID=28051 RepID=UPI000480D76E|nr:AAA family ATPase [Lachnospira multipara]
MDTNNIFKELQEPRTLTFTSMEYDTTVKSEIYEWFQKTPFSEFYNEISKRVIGQDSLKLVLANVYNYLSGVLNGTPIKNNMLLSAPSGCGKTETYRALKDYFSKQIPSMYVYIYDVSAITSNGFKGQDANSILVPFFQEGIENPVGIVFLDEFDKKMVPVFCGTGENINREVQSGMLTIIEGGEVRSPKGLIVNTDKLMFVGLGSFDLYRENRDNKPNQIGLGSEWSDKDEDHYKPLTRDDMVDAGASSEIMGRFPYIVNYERLSEESVEKIINKCVNEAAESFNLNKLVIEEPVLERLKESANSRYGCRLIEATLKEMLLKAYTNEMMNAPGYGKLSMRIKDINDIKTKWEKAEFERPITFQEQLVRDVEELESNR